MAWTKIGDTIRLKDLYGDMSTLVPMTPEEIADEDRRNEETRASRGSLVVTKVDRRAGTITMSARNKKR